MPTVATYRTALKKWALARLQLNRSVALSPRIEALLPAGLLTPFPSSPTQFEPLLGIPAAAKLLCVHPNTHRYEGALITPMLTAQELSRIVPLHPVTILRWARENRIPHHRLSARKIVFLPSEINKWLSDNSSMYAEPVGHAALPERIGA